MTVTHTRLPTVVSGIVFLLKSVYHLVVLLKFKRMLIVCWPESSATLDSISLLAVGASLTSVTLKPTVAVLLFGSAKPLVVPLSVMVYWRSEERRVGKDGVK